jgi:hypothetical protein
MTIEQTIDIPANREVTIRLVAPESVPCGRRNVIVEFPDPKVRKPTDPRSAIPGENDKDGLNLHPTAEQIAAAMAGDEQGPELVSYETLEEALAASDRRLAAEKADPSLHSLKHWYGILKDSKAWGQDVNVEAEIRKMRDEWPDYWGNSGNTAD